MADENSKYLELITSEYATKPKFNAMVKAYIDMLCPVVDNLNSFDSIFNLDNAVGDQLDICGQIIGLTRELPFDDPDVPSVLSDDLFRKVIRARILSNFWDGTTESWANIIEEMIPEAVFEIIDNQDMSISVVIIVPDLDPAIIALLFNGYIVPKPAGVNINWTIQETAFFGWDRDTNFIQGWDSGIWSYI